MSVSLAAVFNGVPSEIELRNITTPQPGAGEILVKVLGCTLCGSDLHSFSGKRAVPTPTILGHEIVGTIEAFGPDATTKDLVGQELRIGDRITWAIVASCGDCFYCRRGLPQKCLQAVKYGHEPLRAGRELLGGMAEHCLLVSGTAIVRLPTELPLAVACPSSCATATVVAAMEAAGCVKDRAVCVVGAGLLGLTACTMSRVQGASEVICVDPTPERRKQSLLFGASQAVSPEELAPAIAGSTNHGVDVLLEFSGASAAFESTWTKVRLGGRIVLVGAVFPDTPVSLPLEQVVRRNLTISGIHNYSPQHLLAAIQFLAEQHERFPLASLVASWRPLADAKQAFLEAKSSGAIRIGLCP